MRKKNKGLITLLLIIIIGLSILCYLLITDKVTVNLKPDNFHNLIKFTKDNSANDYKELVEKYGDGFIKMSIIENSENGYSVGLKENGEVIINFEDKIENIKEAINIEAFSDSDEPGADNNIVLYILDKNGDLFKYTAKDYKNKILTATKMEEYSNVERIFTYYSREKNKGGCDKLIIYSNNDYIELKSFCV